MEAALQKLISVVENNTAALNSLASKGQEEKATPASQTTATSLYGVGGLWGVGVERDIISAHVTPRGILSALPRIPTLSEDPTYGIVTGYTDVDGDYLTGANVCDDAPSAYMKSCRLMARFGLQRFDSKTIDALEVIRKVNRGDFTDLVLRGRVLGMPDYSPSGLDESKILNIYAMSEMVNTAIQQERQLSQAVWQGAVNVQSAVSCGFPGLDAQIATGQVDADTNQACPAADSDVKDFNYNDVCGTGLDIVEYISMVHTYLTWNAESMRLDPMELVIAMRPQLFRELTACWPCSYLTNRCSDSAGTQVAVINDKVNVDMTREMRSGNFLWVNGEKVPVIQDTGIYEATNITDGNLEAGQYASSIYFVPLTITGGFPVTTLEYLDYTQAAQETAFLRDMQEFWWTDNGFYSWALEFAKWCFKFSLRDEPRVVLRAPHLAGKIDNVMYQPLQHTRDPYPDSPYYYDGGVSVRGSSTRYAVWG